MKPYRCPIGRPTLTAAGLELAKKALDEGSLSEGKYVALFEEAFAKMAGVKHAIVTSSGHTALVLALRAAKNLYRYEAVVTSSLTFISTVTAALQAGLAVECVDVDDNFLIQRKAAEDAMIRWNTVGRPALYLPVHLFGQEAPAINHSIGMTLHDSCEAMGSVDDGMWIGIRPIGCFSFYTSHVLGAGEMGMVVTDRDDVAKHIRQLKDQGRAVLRPVRHIEGERLQFQDRYRHDFEGWNFRTSDVHAALILGNLPSLREKITRRFANFSALHRMLAPLTERASLLNQAGLPPIIKTLEPHPRFSYLAFPIICRHQGVRDDLVTKLEEAGVETRPIMSVMQREVAVQHRIISISGCSNAVQLHNRSLYVSCHDQLSEQDMEYIAETIKRAVV